MNNKSASNKKCAVSEMSSLSKNGGMAVAGVSLAVLLVIAVISAGAAFGWYDSAEPHGIEALEQNGKVRLTCARKLSARLLLLDTFICSYRVTLQLPLTYSYRAITLKR